MSHRRSIPALLAALLLLVGLALAGPVLAKDGMQARLDAPIPIDAPPGTTLDVGWTTTVPDGAGGAAAFSGAPVFIALTAPGASEPEALVFGDEAPAGSGHFTASIVVPDGGIAPDGVMIGLRSEMCENGTCQRSWMPFELLGAVLTTTPAAPVVAASQATAVSPVPVAAPDPTEPSVPSVPLLLVLVGVLAASAAGASAFAVARRRRLATPTVLAPE